jgi:hypothetical protein
VLVRVDLDCAQARVAAQGHVTVQSVQALYAVMKRANSLMAIYATGTYSPIEPSMNVSQDDGRARASAK